MRALSYGSLCTGYDGLGLGLALAGVAIDPRWLAETEPAMCRVLKRGHDGVPNVGDIKSAPWHLAPHVQIMSSGDPCQSISIAGRQEGRSDPRFLWPWVRQAYRAVLPDALFFENVANIVSHDGGRTLAERNTHLREDGYEVRWCVLGACAVGAPHHRHRYYAVAARWTGEGSPPAPRRIGGDKAICGAPRLGRRLLLPTCTASDKESNPGWSPTSQSRAVNLRTAVSMLPTPAARDGGERGTPSHEHAIRRLADPNRSNNLEDVVAGLLPTPTVSNASGNKANGETPPRLLLPGIAVQPEVWGKYAEAVALWENITGVPAPAPTELGAKGAPRLSAALPEWMMGLRPGLLTDELSRPEALRGAGNGVVPLAAAAAWQLLTAPLSRS